MFKYLISGASEVHPRYADFIFCSFSSPENGLSSYFEMRNLKCSLLLPGLPILPLSTLVLKCHACADPEGGGGGVGGPDPIPGKSQVLSNSIEISIWTPHRLTQCQNHSTAYPPPRAHSMSKGSTLADKPQSESYTKISLHILDFTES